MKTFDLDCIALAQRLYSLSEWVLQLEHRLKKNGDWNDMTEVGRAIISNGMTRADDNLRYADSVLESPDQVARDAGC